MKAIEKETEEIDSESGQGDTVIEAYDGSPWGWDSVIEIYMCLDERRFVSIDKRIHLEKSRDFLSDLILLDKLPWAIEDSWEDATSDFVRVKADPYDVLNKLTELQELDAQ